MAVISAMKFAMQLIYAASVLTLAAIEATALGQIAHQTCKISECTCESQTMPYVIAQNDTGTELREVSMDKMFKSSIVHICLARLFSIGPHVFCLFIRNAKV